MVDAYVFANQKGGVGKTTVTLGVAAELAARRRRVLVIDLDPQASATKVLGVELGERCSMADVMLEPDRYALCGAIAATDWGFDLAPSETALASRESRRATADEFVLKRQLEGVAGYDVVLIDRPPSLGVLTLNALATASRLVVVTEPSFLALQGIVGAVVGWLIFTAGLGIVDTDVFDLGGILSALIGVVIVLLVAGAVMRRGRGGGQPNAST